MPVQITDIKKLFSVQVYTVAGHWTLLAGSESEAVKTANLLFLQNRKIDVYKVKVLDYYDNVVYQLV